MAKKSLDYIYNKYGSSPNWMNVICKEKLDAEFIRENHTFIDIDFGSFSFGSDSINMKVLFELSQINRMFIAYNYNHLNVFQIRIYDFLANYLNKDLMKKIIDLNFYKFDAKCWSLFSGMKLEDDIFIKHKDKIDWMNYCKNRSFITPLMKNNMPEYWSSIYCFYNNMYYKFKEHIFLIDHQDQSIINWINYTCYEADNRFLIDRQYDIGHWSVILKVRQLPEDFIISLLHKNLITIYEVIENQYMSEQFFRQYHSIIPWKDKSLKIKSFEHFSLKTIKELLPKWKYNYFREYVLQ